MLYVDPTELRDQSRLPKDVVEVAKPLPHLEDLTGADMLITIRDYPATSEALLRSHCESGTLVQFKRRSDFMSSIITEDRLWREIYKMRLWCSRPWLVITGVPFDIRGSAVIGEISNRRMMPNDMASCKLTGHKGLSYAAVDGAFDAWQYYGGYSKYIPDDSFLLSWINRQTTLLKAIDSGDVSELPPRSVQRELIDSTQIAWLAALFDGVGRKTALVIFETLHEKLGRIATLYEAIGYVLSYMAVEIPGITMPKIAEWRKVFGLRYIPESELFPALYESPTTGWRLEDTGELYWKGPATSWHYRSTGYIEKDKVFTVGSIQSLLGQSMAVTYLNGQRTKELTGISDRIEVDAKFEYLVLTIGGNEENKIRVDLITDINLLEGKEDG